jgi:hypothetical protein
MPVRTGQAKHLLTAYGERVLTDRNVDVDRLRTTRRVFARSCLDWTQRRPHLAGALPAAITSAFLDQGWLTRINGRGLQVSPRYEQQLDLLLTP